MSSLTLWSRRDPFADFDKLVLRLLDGTRDREALVDEIIRAVDRGELNLGERRPRSEVAAALDHALSQFRVAGLLVA